MSPQVLHRASARTRTFALAVAGALAASMLVASPATAGTTELEDLESALCPGGSSAAGPVKLTKDIDAAPSSNIETLTIVAGCETILDLDGFELIVGNVMIEPTAKLTIRDTSTAGTGVLDATAALASPASAGAPNGAADGGLPGISVTAEGQLTRNPVAEGMATLVIEGGTIRATGGDAAAGIGSYCSTFTTSDVRGDCWDGYTNGGRNVGEIIVTGGVVIAQGGKDAAGIGGGYRGTVADLGAGLKVSGGTVTATGGPGGAGIGGGYSRNGIPVEISDGTVTAVGGSGAAGVGPGETGVASGTLRISGGTLVATAGAGVPDPSPGGGHFGNLQVVEFDDGVKVRCAVVEHTLGPVRTTISFNTDCLVSFPPPTGPTGPSGAVTSGSAAVDVPVSAAVAAASAAGVAGSSSAVLVRGGEVVPITSSSAAGAGPRGGVVLEAEGLKVTVAAAGGASPQTGVIAPVGGEIVCELCAAFAAGSTIEAWMYSSPQLTAAVQVPDDHQDGDCILLRIPVGAPLTGEPVAAGAHTLQLRMSTQDGLEVLATGVTVGTAVPSSVPAGEGPVGRGLLGMFGLLAVAAAAAVRRQVVTG